MDSQTAVKVSCGFGGGMMIGSVCGAVTGGIMALGLKRGGTGMQAGLAIGKTVRQFTDRFKAQHKSVNCFDLTGFDPTKIDFDKPEVMAAVYKEAQAKKLFAACTGFVKDATAIVTEILNEPSKT